MPMQYQKSHQTMAASKHLRVEAGGWHLLTPPGEENDKVEVGVVSVHPSQSWVAYTTRNRNDQSQDLGKTRIGIHDFDQNSNTNVVALFTLRELNKRINEFRTKSHLSMMAASAQPHSQDMLHSLSATTPSPAMPYTVQMLGAIQSISFLSRDAIRCQVPHGYVRGEPSRMQRLMIGFRRCIVVVSIFHLKHQKETYAQGVQVMAYIGPDDIDEWEQDEKARKRQPSSFPIAISENLLAYGCYDGGIRFYDVVRRKQAKSALGPNGRGNPIVRVINANRTQSNDGKTHCQTILPRIISVCASGAAYLWELDLSIDLDSGEVLYFDIPPPLASFDGLVAAVSGKGLPLKYPPPLSPTSIATLSPCSSWEQTDEVNAQFEVSFDSRRNWLFWMFSPDAIGSTVRPHATREERLDMSGTLVCWDLTTLPGKEWPPAVQPPHCVSQLPRTKGGRVSPHMVVPGIHGVLPHSNLVSLYITSSSELVAAVADLGNHGGSVQLDNVSVMTLADLKTLNTGRSEVGYVCFAISWTCPSLVAIGTQHGILFAEVSESNDVRRQLFSIQEEPIAQPVSQGLPGSSIGKASILAQEQQIFAQRIKELECRNEELECQLDGLKHEVSKMISEEEHNKLQSRMKAQLEHQANLHETSDFELNAALSEARNLENDLSLKNQDLEAKVEALKGDLEHVGEALVQERQINQDVTRKLTATEDKARSLEAEAISRNGLMRAVQEECDDLRQQVDEFTRNERESNLTKSDYLMETGTSDTLRKALVAAKDTEDSLRNYISLLEEDKSIMDKEVEDLRQQADKYAKKNDTLTASLRGDLKEQKSAIDSLVDLLERQRMDHEKETDNQNDEINSLKKQLSELQLKHKTALEVTKRSNEKTITKLKAENAVMNADASMGNEIFLAMKVELQNALNDLAEYQREHEHKR